MPLSFHALRSCQVFMPGFFYFRYTYTSFCLNSNVRKGKPMPELPWLIAVVIVAILGVAVGFVISRYLVNASSKKAAEEAEQLVASAKRQAETLRREAVVEAKDEVFKMKQEAQAENKERMREVRNAENRINQREESLDRRVESLDAREHQLSSMQGQVERRERDLKNAMQEVNVRLERVAGMTPDEAKQELLDSLRDEVTHESAAIIREAEQRAKLEADKKSREILSLAIQRVAADHSAETTVKTIHIPSDDLKGRIIGREGRNIRALEAATGVEIVVDDTPEAIVISAFDPVRREVCRLALHQLVADGRIHPARIEEVVAKVKKQLDNEIIETGKRTAIDLGIHGLHPELIRIVGKMKYRSSYGQNLLQHARETANLCAVMAAELGLNPKKAKRAGLLHDIGKVPDEESELPHALYGAKIAEKYKEKPDICNAIGAHHDEMEMNTLLAPIVQVCDAISGARPGARREIVEAYIKRLNDLEAIAMSYPGVTKTYAIQAGRELRVIVGADKMDDKETEKLSGEIANKIQTEMTYPGQVKITVIRETRSVAYAK